jgi:hypothetical protein
VGIFCGEVPHVDCMAMAESEEWQCAEAQADRPGNAKESNWFSFFLYANFYLHTEKEVLGLGFGQSWIGAGL